jgi:hypothetical protein
MAYTVVNAMPWVLGTTGDFFNFAIWANTISEGVAAAGWEKIHTNTPLGLIHVSPPTSYNWQAAATEIWRTTDSLTPWYLKIQYCRSTNYNCCGLQIQFGTTAADSGTSAGWVLGGTYSSVFQLALTWYSTTSTTPMIVAGDGSWLTMALNCSNSTAYGLVFSFERIKDTLGADTDFGAVAFSCSQGTVCQQETLILGGHKWGHYQGWSAMASPVGSGTAKTTSGEDITIGLSTVHPWAQTHYPPCLGLVSYHGSTSGTNPDLLYGTSHLFSVVRADGVSHQYLPLFYSGILSQAPYLYAALRCE